MPIDASYPVPCFALSCAEREGLPVVAVINAALAGYVNCRDFPWLVEVQIRATQSDDRGLPTVEEVEQLNAIEERIEAALAAEGAHFVARQTWSGRRMLDYYVADGATARRQIGTFVEEGAFARPVTVQTSRDDSWKTWMPTLVRMGQPPIEKDAAGSPELGEAVFVRIPLAGGEFGSDDEQEAVLALSDALTEILADSETGVFDGYEFGGGAATLFAYGADADALFAALEPALRAAPVTCGAVITKRHGTAHNDTDGEVTVAL